MLPAPLQALPQVQQALLIRKHLVLNQLPQSQVVRQASLLLSRASILATVHLQVLRAMRQAQQVSHQVQQLSLQAKRQKRIKMLPLLTQNTHRLQMMQVLQVLLRLLEIILLLQAMRTLPQAWQALQYHTRALQATITVQQRVMRMLLSAQQTVLSLMKIRHRLLLLA